MNKILPICLMALCVASCKDVIPAFRSEKDRGPVKVVAQTLEPVEAPQHHCYVGKTEADKTVSLSSLYPGTLVSLKVRKGDTVKEGQVVAEIRSQAVESTFKTAKAALEQATDAYDRMMKVYPEGTVSEIQMMDVKTKLTQAEAAMESASKAVEDCRIKAPYAGVISGVLVDEGVELAPAQPVVTIMDVSGLEITISVHENEISKIREGDVAGVEVPAFGLEGLKARVISKDLLCSPLSHSYECTLRFDRKPERVLPGMTVKVRFDRSGEKCLIVPVSAVQVDKDGKYVWLYVDGIVRKAPVTLGEYAGKGVVVTGGLEPGDRIITAGYQKVSGGMKVVLQ